MILDEPTNHLDVDAREALVMALNDFEGAVILISHDRHLLAASVDRLWVVRNGTVQNYDGDMEQYRRECLDERSGRKRDKGKAGAAVAGSSADKNEQRKAGAEKRGDVAPLKKAVGVAEKKVTELQGQIEGYDKKLADDTLYTRDPAKAAQLAKERGKLLKDLDAAEAAWLAASEAYEAAVSEMA
jgi:ATP-binding cassette, subfamily F, member 3